MKYETAQKLKNAGFPQYANQIMSAEEVTPQNAHRRLDHKTFDLSLMGYPKTEPDYYTQGKWRASCIFSKQYLESEEGRTETLYFPTLDELINECPKESPTDSTETFTLRYCYLGYWVAGYEAYECWSFEAQGETQEEAVAELYLKLKKYESN